MSRPGATKRTRVLAYLSGGRALVRLADGSTEIQHVKGAKLHPIQPGRRSSVYNWRGGLSDLSRIGGTT
jgi:hypothetical protein